MNVRFRSRRASRFSARNGTMRISAVLLIGTMVLISDCLAVFAEEPVGTIKITRRSVAEGVGLSWGDGVLSFGGRDYAFTFEARGLMRGVDPRMAATELVGEVFVNWSVRFEPLPYVEGAGLDWGRLSLGSREAV